VTGKYYPYGLRATISVASPDDLDRNFLKSDSTFVAIPEIDLEACL